MDTEGLNPCTDATWPDSPASRRACAELARLFAGAPTPQDRAKARDLYQQLSADPQGELPLMPRR